VVIYWRSQAASLELFADGSVYGSAQDARLYLGKMKSDLLLEAKQIIAAVPSSPGDMKLLKSAECLQTPKQETRLYIVRNGHSGLYYEFFNCREMIFEHPSVRKLLQTIDALFIDPNLVSMP
jgi:hypothetical protein